MTFTNEIEKHKIMRNVLTVFTLIILSTINSLAATKITIDNIVYTVNEDGETCTLSDGSSVKGTELNIPETITYKEKSYTVTIIGVSAFNKNTNIQSVILPNSITEISTKAFYNCNNLSSIKLSGNLKSIKYYAFGFVSIKEISLPESIEEIVSDAFRGCSQLEKVKFEGTPQLSTIDNYTFQGCAKLKEINIPISVTNIGEHAFYGCQSLTDITLPENITSIGANAFEIANPLGIIHFHIQFTKPATLGTGAFKFLTDNKSQTAVFHLDAGQDLQTFLNNSQWNEFYYALELNDETTVLYSGNYYITLNRSFTQKGWSTLILPCDADATTLKGKIDKICTYTGTTENVDGSLTLNFKDITTNTIVANTPYFVHGVQPSDNDEPVTIGFTKIKGNIGEEIKTTEYKSNDNNNHINFVGTLVKVNDFLQAGDWFIASDNKFYCVSSNTKSKRLKATRGVFRPTNTSTAKSLSFRIEDGETTGIHNLNDDKTESKRNATYNLAGQRVNENYNGLIIKGGKKWIRR